MVVVIANGNGVNSRTSITQRITVAAEAQYNVSSEGEKRALAGLSAGSGATLSTLWAHRVEFAYIGPCRRSAAFPATRTWRRSTTGTELLRVYFGDVQDSPMERR